MSWFNNLPVQRKLGYAMMLTTLVALVLTCGVFLIVEYRSYRRDIERTVATLGRLTADNSTAAIAFEDRASAAQVLDALHAEPQIVSAALYDSSGRLFASFRANPDEILRATVPSGPAEISFAEKGYVVGVQPVTEGTRRLGTLYLRASMADIFLRMQTYAWVVLGVLASAVGLAGLVASQLRSTLARPILELANTASAVSARQDYALRARQYSEDELGRLTATFNAMLETTQSAVGALQESEWGHRELVRALPAAAYMCDAHGGITLYNDAAVALWGRSPELGREFWCGSHRMYRADGTPLPHDESPVAVALKAARSVRHQEIIIERPDGVRRNVMPHPEPVRDIAGSVVGVVNMLVDITEQKAASAAIQQLASIVEFSEDAIIGKNLNGIITSWNHGAENLYGYAAAEIIGQSVLKLLPPDRRDEESTIVERILRDERVEQYETVRQHRDGTLIDVSLTVSPIKDPAGRVVGASKIARDITARKQAEAALRAREAQLRLVTDNAPVFLVRIDRQFRFTFVNRAYAERNDYAAEELIGVPVIDIIGPNAYAVIEPHMIAALTGERVEFEVKMPYSKIGHRWVHVIYVPERDAEGQVVGLLGVLSDTGARKEAEIELKRARDEALASSRAKDDFLAALSHELRTPLNPVLLLASDAASNLDLPPSVRADFDLIRKNVNLEARLIDDLLDLTRISRGKLSLEKRRCDLQTILKDALGNVRADSIEKEQSVNGNFDQAHSVIDGDSVRLQQVFWNILKNAVKFTPKGGQLWIDVKEVIEDRKVVVKITDSGIGLTPDEMSRIFQAFSQGDHAVPGAGSHRFGGLGLGLAISKMLVEMHGGQIRALSEGRGHGATFEVDLPLVADHAANPGAPAHRSASTPPFGVGSSATQSGNFSAAAPHPARPRILLVEDHAPTRQTLQHLLVNRRYEVASAESATEAMKLAGSRKFDLVVSDVGLPDRNGYELMVELLSVQPRLTGIALSGYGMEEDLLRSRAAGFSVHLVKPVTIGMLEEAITKLSIPALADPPNPPSSA